MKLARINSQKPFSNAILNMNKMARDQVKSHWRKEMAEGVQIDLEEEEQQLNSASDLSDRPLPFASMR
jgi:hypothetical protein